MRTFLWVEFIGSALGFLFALFTLGTSAPWPRVESKTRAIYVIRVMLALAFGMWEAWLLWGAR